ncbi:MAG: SUMF1/EgtB/PvdO family nonheme iron enzyme [Spirochaetia bacterium]|nr:SUMF1/EgtB/PvdO family nonheme iron enzyme [Spirochaetia bacterium]
MRSLTQRALDSKRNFSFAIQVVVVSMGLLSCAVTRGPEEFGGLSRRADAEEIQDTLDISVDAPGGTFQIDRFEEAEPIVNDFLPVRNIAPRTRVTHREAQEFCARSGRRLCTRYEWKNACLGTQRRRFGYGSSFVQGRCNVETGHVIVNGGRPDCVTDSGVHDMVGNVMEWVSDSVDGRSVALGGSFVSGQATNCFTENFFPEDTRNGQIGFRCCR